MTIEIPEMTSEVQMDAAHNALIFALILAHKPKNVLELGIGTAKTSMNILAALDFNSHDSGLTSVDDWSDVDGNPPMLPKHPRWSTIKSREHIFLNQCPGEWYDMIISDADHVHSGYWIEQHFRILRPGGIFVAHDVNPHWPSLWGIKNKLSHLNPMLFNRSSLPMEKCERGLLVCQKPIQ